MTPPRSSPIEGAIDVYLDTLLVESRDLPPRARRMLLNESESHLLESAEAAEAGGLTRQQAESLAVRRFGAPPDIVGPYRRAVAAPSIITRQVAVTGLFLGAIGAVAVGISGLVAAVIRWFEGSRALVDWPAGGTPAPSDCARWLRLDPHALDCRTAAVSDWANETVAYRIILGLMGALVLLGLHVYFRRRGSVGRAAMLPPLVRDTVAATLFAAAGAGTLVLGVDAIVTSSGFGSGQWLSAAPVALLLAGFYAFKVTRRLPAAAG